MSEKTEKATAHKLKKAKEKGQVSKSNELSIYTAFLIVLAVLFFLWPPILTQITTLLKHTLSNLNTITLTPDNSIHLAQKLGRQIIAMWLPIASLFLLVLILMTLLQTGLTWAPQALVPDFNRLNPALNLKKWCSIARLFDAAKSFFKLLVAFTALTFILYNNIESLIQNTLKQPHNITYLTITFILTSGLKITCLLLLFAFIDKQFTRWQFNKEQKMTKHEVKEEYKQKEGDPKLKSKIKQLQRQLRQKTAALKGIKNADVLITNPTHIAIALRYDRTVMPAPKVIYKAQNKMVASVKILAKKYNIPIIEHKVLARMLHYSSELNQYIHKELFPLTAEVFRELYNKESR